MSHTPGPWKIEDNLIIGADGYDVCEISTRLDSKDGSVEMDANAVLIAAAPELLEALEEIAKGEGVFSRDQLIHAFNCVENMKEIAQAAISKAKGDQS